MLAILENPTQSDHGRAETIRSRLYDWNVQYSDFIRMQALTLSYETIHVRVRSIFNELISFADAKGAFFAICKT